MKKILVYEEQLITALHLKQILKDFELIINSKSLSDCLDTLEREDIDLVIFHVSKSDELIPFLKTIRIRFNIPILITSSIITDKEMLIKLGCSFIIKPFKDEEIVHAVKKCLN